MNKTLLRTLTVLLVALAVVLLGTVAVAETDAYQVNYYANAHTMCAPDATVYIDNPGAANYGPLCALIYVFTADQQMVECCGCNESPNDLNTLSVDNDLTSNPLTSTIPTAGVIKIVSAPLNGSVCDPTSSITPPTPDLRAWATHIQSQCIYSDDSGYAITETPFLDAKLSSPELDALQSQCAFIGILGSGHGICTCGTGATSPNKKKKK